MPAGSHDRLFADIISQLKHGNTATDSTITGCNSIEIDTFIRSRNGQVPQIYKAFLRYMGRGAGKFFVGTHFFYPAILDLETATIEMFRDASNPIVLPPNTMVFSMHQGYDILLLEDATDSDPVVLGCSETSAECRIVSSSYSEFLKQAARREW